MKKTPIYSLVNNQLLGYCNEYENKEEIINVYKLANQAFANFKYTPYNQIIKQIKNFIDLINNNINEFANLITLQVHKTFNEAKKEIIRTIDFIKLLIKESEKLNDLKGIIKTPIGVVSIICSYNYPFNLNLIKIIMCLLTNNTVVIKASNNTCLVINKIIELLEQSNFNNNIVNMINVNDDNLYEYLYSNEYVKYIFFTGSTKVAKHIINNINHFVKYCMEGSTKNYAVIWNDMDLEKIVDDLINGCFLFNGQRCTSIKMILCHKDIYDHLCGLITKKTTQLNVGSCLDNHNFVTEMISLKSIKSSLLLVDDAINKGAKPLLDIKQDNLILHPVILKDIPDNANLLYQEQFAPICCLKQINDINEAIDIIDKSEYGLQACIYSKQDDIIEEFIKKVDVGRININTIPSRSPDELPFYSTRESSFGYQGSILDIIKSLLNFKLIFKKNI